MFLGASAAACNLPGPFQFTHSEVPYLIYFHEYECKVKQSFEFGSVSRENPHQMPPTVLLSPAMQVSSLILWFLNNGNASEIPPDPSAVAWAGPGNLGASSFSALGTLPGQREIKINIV